MTPNNIPNHFPSSVEIMAPAGSFESLMAALQAGANSVYFGVGKLNMRSRSANNFTPDDLEEISRLCREKGVKTYLTLNIIIYDEEVEEMQRTVQYAARAGISAIIASDLSVIQYAHSQGLEVHISTQCNITNLEAVRFYARFADVMVTARELSLKQVAAIVEGIRRENITGPSGRLVEIEVFVHGALCMAVSGKCYLSLDNMNASANRGECLQLCRRSYLVTDKDEKIQLEIDNEYIMSPRDLCTIGFLDKILKAGVGVLKIEGRGRGPEYVKTVTQCYREAATAVQQGTYSIEKIDGWLQRLRSVYNRGFWDGYYLGRRMGEWTERYGSMATRKKQYLGLVTNYFSRLQVAEIRIETNAVEVGEPLLITGPTTGVVEMDVPEIRIELQNAPRAQKGETCSIPVGEVVRRGDKVFKWVQVEDLF